MVNFPRDKLTQDFAKTLLRVTAGCREDMHEPDEQGISAHVVGDHLDNAHGDSIGLDAIMRRYQELVVVIKSESEDEGRDRSVPFNLATLIALARVGAQSIVSTKKKETTNG